MRIDDLMVGLLGPILAALAAAVGVWLRDRLQRRDEQFMRRTALDQASREVAFIQAWVAARHAVKPTGENDEVLQRASHDLERIYAILKAPTSEASQERQLANVSSILRSWLLVGALVTLPAKIGRVLYYALLLLALFVISIFTELLISDPTLSGFSVWLVATSFFGGLLAGTRSVVLWIERAVSERTVRRAWRQEDALPRSPLT